MGFVPDESDSSAETSILPDEACVDDEESHSDSSRLPLLTNGAYPNPPRTPTSKNNDLLGITRLRRKTMTEEADEIWDELEDEDPSSVFPSSQRRSSARSFPTRMRPHSATATENSDDGLPPDENTALLGRSNTGRSYRDHRRRRSMPLGETLRSDRRMLESQDAVGGWWKMRWWGRQQDGEDGWKRQGTANREASDE